MPFKVGDVVNLTCGGQTMTVIAAEEGAVTVTWHKGDGDLVEAVFPEVALVEYAVEEGDE